MGTAHRTPIALALTAAAMLVGSVMFTAADASELQPPHTFPAHGELQPLLRYAPDDAIARQADLLARLYRGRVYALLADASLPKGVVADDALVTEPAVAEQLRPGDLVAVRTSGDPAPYITDPVSLRRFVRLEDCGDACRRVATAAVNGGPAETVKWLAVTGRIVFAMHRRTGELRELRDPEAPRPVTLAEAYNAWRPQWTAEAVGTRLQELEQPPTRRPRRIYRLDALQSPARADGATDADALRR